MSFRDPLRGDNVHNMMVDPSTVNSRIYIGNIPTSDMTKKDLEDRFLRHGPILGVALNRGFGFIQYEQDNSAVDAIRLEHGSVFKGKKIEVNAARIYGGRGRMDGPGGRMDGPGPRRGDSDDRDSFRERSPIDDRGRERDWRDRDRFDNFSSKGSMDRGSFFGRDSSFGKEPSTFSGPDQYRPISSGPTRDDRGSSYGKDSFGGPFRPSSVPKDYPPTANINPIDRANDCEIIVFNKSQREYAEYIEHRLKQLGLTVDLLFPNEEVPIGRVLANISSRGSLYAIVVLPQNEEHRSLTLNILHGLPQEHRNMPLDDAVPLLKRNFEAYTRGEKAVPGVPTPISVAPNRLSLSERHPEAIQVLLGLLSDNRQLTVLQYDRVIRYLQDKRELQVKIELGDAKDLPSVKEPATKQQVELQHRILNILNNTTTGGGGAVPSPTPVAPPSGNWQQQSTPLLNDPTVQKALDSLMQGNLLRKITPGVGGMVNNPGGTMSSLGTPPSQPLFGAVSSAWNTGPKMM